MALLKNTAFSSSSQFLGYPRVLLYVCQLVGALLGCWDMLWQRGPGVTYQDLQILVAGWEDAGSRLWAV